MVIEVDVKEAPFLQDKKIELEIDGIKKTYTIFCHYSDKKGVVIYHIPPSFPKEIVSVIFGQFRVVRGGVQRNIR